MHAWFCESKKDKELYVGYSSDVRARIAEHQRGKVASTATRRPFELIYCELYTNRKDAMRREQFLKTGWGRNYIKRVLANTLQ